MDGRALLPILCGEVEFEHTVVLHAVRRDRSVWFALGVPIIVAGGQRHEIDGHVTLFYLRGPPGADMPPEASIRGYKDRGDQFLERMRRKVGKHFRAKAQHHAAVSVPAYEIFDLLVQWPIHNTLHQLCRVMAGTMPLRIRPAFHLSVRAL